MTVGKMRSTDVLFMCHTTSISKTRPTFMFLKWAEFGTNNFYMTISLFTILCSIK